MRSIDVTRLLSVDHVIPIDRFWTLVERAYREVLEGTDDEAVSGLRSDIAERPAEEQVLFYHEEPLNVALDLVEREDQRRGIEPTPDQIKDYLAIARELGGQPS
jgi:hypothetical protein